MSEDMLHVVKWHNGNKEWSPFSDGEMARLPDLIEFAGRHRLRIGTIADLIEYRRALDTDAIATAQASRVPAGMAR